MSKNNPEYDFQWCPGCGDFGVRRAIEQALAARIIELNEPVENTVVVAGIGCSGNMVHLLEGPHPFGIHGIHGRTLPIAFGIKGSRPELNVLVVAGDGDFLSIGAEHIGPQAQRNLNVTCVIMDNGVYGLTKGQSSPTTELEKITPTTPFGKVESPVNPQELFLTQGVSFIASCYSSRVKELSALIKEAMAHPGFSIVHVQSPCVTYNDTHEEMKGNPAKGIIPRVFPIPEDHDRHSKAAAAALIARGGTPLGVVYQQPESKPLDVRYAESTASARPRSPEQLMAAYAV